MRETNAYKFLLPKPEGGRLLRRQAEMGDNIKMLRQETWQEGVEWINLGQNRDQWQAVIYGNESSGSTKLRESID
jgi:hypothetical protein